MSDEELQDAIAAADDLEQGILGFVALGGEKKKGDSQSAIDELVKARDAIENRKTTEARAAVIRGLSILEDLVNANKIGWRIVNLHQLPLFVYHLAFVAAFIAVGTTCINCAKYGVVPNAILGDAIPTTAIVSGGLGAQLRGIWFLWKQVSRRIYLRRFLLSQLAAPVTGMLLGMVTYLLAKAGLFVIGGQTAGRIVGVSASVGELALCFFVGFKWEWALQRIGSIFERSAQPPSTQT